MMSVIVQVGKIRKHSLVLVLLLKLALVEFLVIEPLTGFGHLGLGGSKLCLRSCLSSDGSSS